MTTAQSARESQFIHCSRVASWMKIVSIINAIIMVLDGCSRSQEMCIFAINNVDWVVTIQNERRILSGFHEPNPVQMGCPEFDGFVFAEWPIHGNKQSNIREAHAIYYPHSPATSTYAVRMWRGAALKPIICKCIQIPPKTKTNQKTCFPFGPVRPSLGALLRITNPNRTHTCCSPTQWSAPVCRAVSYMLSDRYSCWFMIGRAGAEKEPFSTNT